jgi:Tau95 Triple barrel domain
VNDPSNVQLELRYRSDDPYEHPIASQSLPVQNLVLKLTTSKEYGTIQNVEVAGVVDRVFRFRGMDIV